MNRPFENLGLGRRSTDEVTFSPTFRPGFFAIFVGFIRLLISRELDHFQKSQTNSSSGR